MDGQLHIFDTQLCSTRATFFGHKAVIQGLVSVARPGMSGHVLIWTASCDGQLKAWDPVTHRCVSTRTIADCDQLLSLVAVDNARLWCGGAARIFVVDLATGATDVVRVEDDPERASMRHLITSMTVAGDSVWSASSADPLIHVWDTRTLRHRHRWYLDSAEAKGINDLLVRAGSSASAPVAPSDRGAAAHSTCRRRSASGRRP